MVRQGPVVSPALATLLVALTLMEGPAAKASGREVAPPIDRLAYKIQLHVAIDPETRLDFRRRAETLSAWTALVRRLVGAPWDVTIADEGSPLSRPGVTVESLGPDGMVGLAAGFDKVWAIRIGREGPGLSLSGREFDVMTRRLGPTHRLPAPFLPDLPRAIFELALEIFAPLAEVGEQSGGGVSITVRGASVPLASPAGRFATAGTVFQPLRLNPQPDGTIRVVEIPFSYLRVESVEGPVARCGIVSALRDPLTRRITRKTNLVALGVKPGEVPTRLRFVTRPDQAPAAGYVLTARTVPGGISREVGTTERDGRIVLGPRFADDLVVVRLLAGNSEPMVELPVMPGQTETERTIPFDPKPLTVTLETRLDSLRDTVIDLIALRARLEARLKARADGEDWQGVEAALKEYGLLPARDTFLEQLTSLKGDAAKSQAETKTAVLTRTAQAQIAEVQSLIDRYLDDELFRAYADALGRSKALAAAPAEAKGAAKGMPRNVAAPPTPVVETPKPAAKPASKATGSTVPF